MQEPDTLNTINIEDATRSPEAYQQLEANLVNIITGALFGDARGSSQ